MAALESVAAAQAAETEAAKAAEVAAVAASRATDATLEIPAPAGLSYLPYQRAGIAYAAGRPSTLIADEMGLGKTIQALGLANLHLAKTGRLRMLVVAPKIALRNWAREASKWLTSPVTVAIWDTKKQPSADVVIVNYDVLSRVPVLSALAALRFDLAVFDECHMLKSAKAQRTKAALGDRIHAARRLFLTGTPILNRPIELQPVLASIGLPAATSYYGFAKRFCAGHDTRFGFDATGASNLPELQNLLRSTCMVRRLKADVLTELPAKRHQVVELDADTPALRAALKAERQATAGQEAAKAAATAAIARARASGDKKALREAVSAMRSGAMVAFQEMSKVRHDTAVAKIDQVIEHTVGILEGSEESVLVFAHHQDVVDGLRTGLEAAGYPCAVITGSTSDTARQAAQDDIQARRKRVFIGSMRACGVAITLTAASTVVFAEQDWTPGIMSQAEDRAHRIGQANAVLVQHLVVDESIDATMAKRVAGKADVAEAALDDEDPEIAAAIAEVAGDDDEDAALG